MVGTSATPDPHQLLVTQLAQIYLTLWRLTVLVRNHHFGLVLNPLLPSPLQGWLVPPEGADQAAWWQTLVAHISQVFLAVQLHFFLPEPQICVFFNKVYQQQQIY